MSELHFCICKSCFFDIFFHQNLHYFHFLIHDEKIVNNFFLIIWVYVE